MRSTTIEALTAQLPDFRATMAAGKTKLAACTVSEPRCLLLHNSSFHFPLEAFLSFIFPIPSGLAPRPQLTPRPP
eukprot:m.61723 g.61723  ORF g.61723 m.61723 type:complete len:75 (-) comp49491_c0_seq2:174-398(-)